jgi:3'(2'), 5'-bisphosphate nucleotidase
MLERELQEARSLAREAGRIVRELYGTAKVEMKGVSNPVTEADKRANAFIVERLTQLFPDDGIVAEESVNIVGAAKKPRCWFVDPLDGTKEFKGQYGVVAISPRSTSCTRASSGKAQRSSTIAVSGRCTSRASRALRSSSSWCHARIAPKTSKS